jgi:proline iminopeptidase
MFNNCIKVVIVLLTTICLYGCTSTSLSRETFLDKKIHIEKGITWEVPKHPRICDSLSLKKEKIDIGNGCKLYVEEEGKGIPIVLINGGPGGGHYNFHPYFSRAAKFSRVIYYDQRGCGLSSYEKGINGEYSFSQAIDDLEKLRKALGVEKWVLLGHSYGGFLAQAYTLKYPENVKGLILVCASTGMRQLNLKEDRNSEFITQKEINKFIEIELAVHEKVVNGKLDRIKGKEIQIYNKVLNGEWKQQSLYKPTKRQMAEHALYYWKPAKDFRDEMFVSMNKYDLTKTFIKSPIPTMIIEGKWDLTWNTDKPEKFHNQHPNSKLVVFEKSSHSPYEDEPEKFFLLIKSFTSNLPNISKEEILKWKKVIPSYIDAKK